jgi:hypothetical protein
MCLTARQIIGRFGILSNASVVHFCQSFSQRRGRSEARQAMLTIANLFSFKEMGGAIEPLILLCGPAIRKSRTE